MNIKFVDLNRQYQLNKTLIDQKIQAVLDHSFYILGPEVKLLEEELAHFVGVKHAIGCSSGTEALLLALLAYDIQPGDEIITTPFTFFATVEMIALLKAKPVFVDIDPGDFNIDPQHIKDAVTPRTKGIITVNLFGLCADHDPINALAQENGLFVIEDAAQSFGAVSNGKRSCSLADAACTSFFPAKPLGCYGDGGMVFTDHDDKARLLRSLLNHGAGAERYDHVRIGINGRLDTLQAAVLQAKFSIYPKEIELRQQVAQKYSAGLKDPVITPVIPEGQTSVFAQYCIRVPKRDELQSFLKDQGIPTAIHYPKPLHLQPALSDLGYAAGDFPNAESVAQNIIALPMHPYLEEAEQDFIVDHIMNFISKDKGGPS